MEEVARRVKEVVSGVVSWSIGCGIVSNRIMQKDTKESTQQEDTTIAKEGMADCIIKTSKQQGRMRRKESRKKYINKQCARHRIILWETAMKNRKRVGRLGSVKKQR